MSKRTQADGTPLPTEDVVRVGLKSIMVNPENPRDAIDPGDPSIVGLRDSIDTHGLLEPLVVVPDPGNDPADTSTWRYLLAAGHRRYAALIGLPPDRRVWSDGVLVHLRRDLAGGRAGNVTATALVENLQREDLSPLQEARAFDALKRDHGWSQADIAEAINRNQGHVSKRLALLKLIPALQSKVASGEVPLEQAVDASKLPIIGQEQVIAEMRYQPVDRAVQIVARKFAALLDRTRLIKELKAAAVPVIDSADNPGADAVKGAVQVGIGNGVWWLPAAEHATCMHRMVWIRTEPRAGATPFDRWAIEYCTADDPVKLHPRDDSADDQGADLDGDRVAAGKSPAAPVPGETAKERKARVAEEAANRAAFEAEQAGALEDAAARREFIGLLLAGKLPKTTADHLARQSLVELIIGVELYDLGHTLAAAQHLLGAGPLEDYIAAAFHATDLVDAGKGGDVLQRFALATRFAVDEDFAGAKLQGDYARVLGAFDAQSTDPIVVGHLRFLADAGLQLSSREEAFLESAGRHAIQAAAIAAELLPAPPEDVKACRECGCTDDHACPGGCSWVQVPEGEAPLCSACAAIAAEAAAQDPPAAAEPQVEPDEVPDPPVDATPPDAVGVPVDELPALPDDMHAMSRPALLELAKRRSVETSPKMTKAQIRSAIEAQTV